ncbi:hypothetical protein NXS19_003025 [Fusarium pseudograminearum]|nr:hypothetical protein NXS19_003025 [Fusarium pseudograminearum]
MFTESSHIQSEKMKKIAYKTEKETISMHVIMCVTLAFLPGTFVAVSTRAMTLFKPGCDDICIFQGFLSKWSYRDKPGCEWRSRRCHLPFWGFQAVCINLLPSYVYHICTLDSAVSVFGA